MPDSLSNRPLRVFLCYASDDRPKVRALYKRLVAQGVDAWLDKEKLLPGQNWREVIPQVVKKSDVVIVCLSKSSISKEGYVQKEIKFALDLADEKPEGTIFIIPLCLDECEVPARLGDLHWVSLFDKGGYKKLLEALQRRAESLRISPIEAHGDFSNFESEDDPSHPDPEPEIKPDQPAGDPTEKKHPRREWNPTITAALIGAAATILAALLGFEPLVRQFMPASTPTVAPASTATSEPTATATPPFTARPSATATSTPTVELTPTPIPQVTTLPAYVILEKGAQMVLISSGTFTMGSNTGNPDEKPVHQVSLDAFYIDKYEVTNRLYQACAKAGGCLPPASLRSNSRPSYYSNPQFDQYPVIWINWEMAQTYCEWRSGDPQHKTRLPTEAEWEYAARSKDGRTYPWGEGIDKTRANYNENVGDTTAVGSYTNGKNVYGLYDMAGNVWEWVADWYAVYPGGDPQAGTKFGQTHRIVRGGVWYLDGSGVRTTLRHPLVPDGQYDDVGFRCARGLSQ
jgi:formylglycine-generating enzyme required for sulfatase activity